ncbi:MAG: hypothetical protein R6U32_05835 [Candidatus Woesearchaeota archaeon]
MGKKHERSLPEGQNIFVKVLAIGIVIFFLLYLAFLNKGGGVDDSVIFLYSDDCSECSALEPKIRGITAKAGMEFSKLRYEEKEATPGFIIIHNNTALISGFRDIESFKKQMCGFTGMNEACEMAGETWD